MRAADDAMPRSAPAPRRPATPSRLARDLVDPCGDPRAFGSPRDAAAHRAGSTLSACACSQCFDDARRLHG
jgi:hypothetical protein